MRYDLKYIPQPAVMYLCQSTFEKRQKVIPTFDQSNSYFLFAWFHLKNTTLSTKRGTKTVPTAAAYDKPKRPLGLHLLLFYQAERKDRYR